MDTTQANITQLFSPGFKDTTKEPKEDTEKENTMVVRDTTKENIMAFFARRDEKRRRLREKTRDIDEEKAQREQPEREERRRRLRVKTRVIGEPIQEHQEEGQATRIIGELTDEKAGREVQEPEREERRRRLRVKTRVIGEPLQEHQEGHAFTYGDCMFALLLDVAQPLPQDTEALQEDLVLALVSP
jgi:hypothetical protein